MLQRKWWLSTLEGDAGFIVKGEIRKPVLSVPTVLVNHYSADPVVLFTDQCLFQIKSTVVFIQTSSVFHTCILSSEPNCYLLVKH